MPVLYSSMPLRFPFLLPTNTNSCHKSVSFFVFLFASSPTSFVSDYSFVYGQCALIYLLSLVDPVHVDGISSYTRKKVDVHCIEPYIELSMG